MQVATAHASESISALQLLFQHLPGSEAHPRVAAARQLLEEPSARLLVARGDGAIVGAVLAQVLPGATGVVFPPRAAAGIEQPARVEDRLLREALAWLRRAGARLVQVTLADEDMSLSPPLLRGGFSRPTLMHYLRHHLADIPPCDGGLFESYSIVDPALFHDVLLRSYQDSLDFPEVDGLRSLNEVLVGYQSSGYDPGRWWLRRDSFGPVGVLLLAEVELRRTWDLTYIGVVPAARRHGHGRALVRKAIAEARSAGVTLLTVSVDGRNVPAIRLYTELGFEAYESRDVYLTLFKTDGSD